MTSGPPKREAPAPSGDAARLSWAPIAGEPTIEVLPDAAAAAAAAAMHMAQALADAVRERGRADWAVTGGSAAVPIYLSLAASPMRDLVPWDRVHVWWGDDRMVPRDHPLSNRLPLDQVLLRATGPAGLSGSGEDARDAHVGAEAGVPLPEANIHGIPIDLALGRAANTDEAAREAAATYASALKAAPLGRDSEGFPVLDVVWVGVGPDGHVLSVFPGSPLLDSTAWASAVSAPTHVEPHVERVSLHPRFLVAARLADRGGVRRGKGPDRRGGHGREAGRAAIACAAGPAPRCGLGHGRGGRSGPRIEDRPRFVTEERAPAFAAEPSRLVASRDGVPIATFEAGRPSRESERPSLLLVHGTTADHTTFRAIVPALGERRHLVAIDRRGRGTSGDGPAGTAYSIEREYDDLAAVAHSVATVDGRPVDVLGHSYGGRIALGAARRSEWIRRIVVYEGAPASSRLPYRPVGVERRIQPTSPTTMARPPSRRSFARSWGWTTWRSPPTGPIPSGQSERRPLRRSSASWRRRRRSRPVWKRSAG